MINYDKEGDVGYTLMVDVDYLAYLQLSHIDLLLLPEMRLINAVTKLVCTFYDKKLCM